MWPGVEDHHNVAENEKCYVNLSRLEQRVDRPRERCPQFKSEISFPSHSAPHSPSFHNIAISSLQRGLSSSLHSFYTQHQDFSIILSLTVIFLSVSWSSWAQTLMLARAWLSLATLTSSSSARLSTPSKEEISSDTTFTLSSSWEINLKKSQWVSINPGLRLVTSVHAFWVVRQRTQSYWNWEH